MRLPVTSSEQQLHIHKGFYYYLHIGGSTMKQGYHCMIVTIAFTGLTSKHLIQDGIVHACTHMQGLCFTDWLQSSMQNVHYYNV